MKKKKVSHMIVDIETDGLDARLDSDNLFCVSIYSNATFYAGTIFVNIEDLRYLLKRIDEERAKMLKELP